VPAPGFVYVASNDPGLLLTEGRPSHCASPCPARVLIRVTSAFTRLVRGFAPGESRMGVYEPEKTIVCPPGLVQARPLEWS
jgi:hypothetical protein